MDEICRDYYRKRWLELAQLAANGAARGRRIFAILMPVSVTCLVAGPIAIGISAGLLWEQKHWFIAAVVAICAPIYFLGARRNARLLMRCHNDKIEMLMRYREFCLDQAHEMEAL